MHYGSGVNSASNRYKYQEYFLGGRGGQWIGLMTLPHSSAKCLEIWEPQPPATLRASPDPYRDYLTFLYIHKTPPFHKWDVSILRLEGGEATTEQPLTVSITLDPLSANLVIQGLPKISVSILNTISQFITQFSAIHHASSQMVNNESTLTVNTKYNSERTTVVQ